jgi:hypothetical protein
MVGVAFSGGGIRSAAFCSGVLRRFINVGIEMEYLSCVSGGGYTGNAYMEWKHLNHISDEENAGWENTFFEHLRNRAGYICNWQNGFWGCFHTFILIVLLILEVILFPICGWASFAFPIAFVVKLLYGQIMVGTKCRKTSDSNDCLERTLLFFISFGIFCTFHFVDFIIKYCKIGNKDEHSRIKVAIIKIITKGFQLFSGFSLAFTTLPWLIDNFLHHINQLVSYFVVILTIIFWFFVPVLRRYSSLVISIYFYSYVVFWHVYDKKMFTIKHTEKLFGILLGTSLCVLAMVAVSGGFQLRLIHIYIRLVLIPFYDVIGLLSS